MDDHFDYKIFQKTALLATRKVKLGKLKCFSVNDFQKLFLAKFDCK